MKKTAVTFVLLCGLTVILQQEGVFPTIAAEEVQSSHESAGLAAEAKPVPPTSGTSLPPPFPSQASESPTANAQVSPITSKPVPNPIPTPAPLPPPPPPPPALPSPPPLPIPPTSAPTVPPDNTSDTASSFCSEWGPWRLEWSDDFIGDRLDPTYWQMVTSQGGYKDINFGVAGLNITACRCAACREENVRVQDGQLKLKSERDPQIARRYYSAAVTTKDRIAWSNKDGPF
ncbi:bglA, partial [Symbiodinium necroappetens]